MTVEQQTEQQIEQEIEQQLETKVNNNIPIYVNNHNPEYYTESCNIKSNKDTFTIEGKFISENDVILFRNNILKYFYKKLSDKDESISMYPVVINYENKYIIVSPIESINFFSKYIINDIDMNSMIVNKLIQYIYVGKDTPYNYIIDFINMITPELYKTLIPQFIYKNI